jgi:hypothetical protein
MEDSLQNMFCWGCQTSTFTPHHPRFQMTRSDHMVDFLQNMFFLQEQWVASPGGHVILLSCFHPHVQWEQKPAGGGKTDKFANIGIFPICCQEILYIGQASAVLGQSAKCVDKGRLDNNINKHMFVYGKVT